MRTINTPLREGWRLCKWDSAVKNGDYSAGVRTIPLGRFLRSEGGHFFIYSGSQLDEERARNPVSLRNRVFQSLSPSQRMRNAIAPAAV
jgi:hypothetical protein